MRTRSLFAQKLDRAAMTSYFLGAVIPLVALGIVGQVFVLDQVRSPQVEYALVAGFVFLGVLSLASFLALRRLARDSLGRMDSDNRRLTQLVSASRELGAAEHAEDVLMTTTRVAQDLCLADAAWILGPGKVPGSFEMGPHHGADVDRLEQQSHDDVQELADVAARERRVVAAVAARGRFEGDGVPSLLVAPLDRAGSEARFLVLAREARRDPFDVRSIDVLTTLAGLSAIALHSARLHEAQRNFFTHVTELLCVALDAHLDRMAGHGQRVAHYANALGRRLGLEDEQLSQLHFASLLHDIGMLRVERSAHRSQSACREHAVQGGRMLARIRLWEHIAPIVAHHHERYDGTGYPDGLAGQDIPLLARIVSIADAFDVMTSRSSYRRPISTEAAARELRENAGRQFDPELVPPFLALVDEGVIP